MGSLNKWRKNEGGRYRRKHTFYKLKTFSTCDHILFKSFRSRASLKGLLGGGKSSKTRPPLQSIGGCGGSEDGVHYRR